MPDADLRWHKSVRAGEVLEVRDEAEWRAETARTLGSGLSGERTRVGEDLLERCVSGDSERPVSITQLAKAMQRVAGLEQAGVYVALDLLARNRVAESIAQAREVLSEGVLRLNTSYAAEVAACGCASLGKVEEAMDSFDESTARDPSRPAPLLGGLAAALESGMPERGREFAQRLNALVGPDDPAVTGYVEEVALRLRSTNAGSRSEAEQTARALLVDENTASGRLCGVYVE